MTGDHFRAELKRLGFVRSHIANDEGLSECARVFSKTARTVRTWAAAGPPLEIALILLMMRRFKIPLEQIEQIITKDAREG